jgi:two-component system, chemotaxis family, chemotaxis protein CheY
MTQPDATANFDLPATLDADAASALIAELNKLPRSSEIRLNAAAVASISLGYLQILLSAFKTFPHLGVADASADFLGAFADYGIDYPRPSDAEIPAMQTVEPSSPTAEGLPAVESPPLLADEASPLPAHEVSDTPTAEAPAPLRVVQPLPAVKEEAIPATDPSEVDQSDDGGAAAKTILTIDDSRTMRDMLKMALGGAGFTVIQAVDGQDGLNALAQQPVDCIITDINMPKLDGFGVIRAVRGDPAYDDTPILVLSTESEQESKDIAKDAGATGWIVKPFDPNGLVNIVNTVCGR